MGRLVTTFPNAREFAEAKAELDARSLPCETVPPSPAYEKVGTPALVLHTEARMALAECEGRSFVTSGWVEHRATARTVPHEEPPLFDEDVFGRASVMVLAPCVAEPGKIRIIAHITGDMVDAFPYLNAVMPHASYNPNGPHLTYMEDGRVVTLYPRRIAAARADEIIDAWRLLEDIRRRINDAWSRRSEIEPSYKMRERPPALEIFKRLPRTNCRACGDATCLAFAFRVWSGQVPVGKCTPVFDGDREELREALLEICSGLGVSAGAEAASVAKGDRE